MARVIKSSLSAVVSGAYFLTQCLCVHAGETTVWESRRRRNETLLARGAAPVVSSRVARVSPLGPLPDVVPAMGAAPTLGALPPSAVPVDLAPLIARIDVGQATVRKIHAPSPSSEDFPTIVLIQDVHNDREAQENIRGTLAALMEMPGMAVVGLEGSVGLLALDGFRQERVRGAVRKTVDFMEERGMLSGALQAVLMGRAGGPVVVGLDGEEAYQANMRAAVWGEAERGRYEVRWKVLEEGMEKRKGELNPGLRALVETVSLRRAGRLGLGAYVEALGAGAKDLAGRYPEVAGFLRALEEEKGLDLKAVEEERKEVLALLVRRLGEEGLAGLVKESESYRRGTMGVGAYYAGLAKRCDAAGVGWKEHRALAGYVRYVVEAEGVDGERLWEEMGRLEEERLTGLAKSAGEKGWVKEWGDLQAVGKLIRMDLTRGEWAGYGGRKAGDMLGVGYPLEGYEAFYREAEGRDGVMGAGMTGEMKKRGGRYGVVVAGGFHTEGLVKRWVRERNRVVVVTPRTGAEGKTEGLFGRAKTPLEGLFEGEKLFLTPQRWDGGTSGTAGVLTVATLMKEGTTGSLEEGWSLLWPGRGRLWKGGGARVGRWMGGWIQRPNKGMVWWGVSWTVQGAIDRYRSGGVGRWVPAVIQGLTGLVALTAGVPMVLATVAPPSGKSRDPILNGLEREFENFQKHLSPENMSNLPTEDAPWPVSDRTLSLWRAGVWVAYGLEARGALDWPGFLRARGEEDSLFSWVLGPSWRTLDQGAFLLEEIQRLSSSDGWSRFGLPSPGRYVQVQRAQDPSWEPTGKMFPGKTPADRSGDGAETFSSALSEGVLALAKAALPLWKEPKDSQWNGVDAVREELKSLGNEGARDFVYSHSLTGLILETLRQTWGDHGLDRTGGPFDYWVLREMIQPYQPESFLWRNFRLFTQTAEPFGQAVALLAVSSHLRLNPIKHHTLSLRGQNSVYWTPEGPKERAEVDLEFLWMLLPRILRVLYPKGHSPLSMPNSKKDPLTVGFLGRYALVSVLDPYLWGGPEEKTTKQVAAVLRQEIPLDHWGHFVEDMRTLADPNKRKNSRFYGLKMPVHSRRDIEYVGLRTDASMNFISFIESENETNPALVPYLEEENKTTARSEQDYLRNLDFFLVPPPSSESQNGSKEPEDPGLKEKAQGALDGLKGELIRNFLWKLYPEGYESFPGGRVLSPNDRTLSLWRAGVWFAYGMTLRGAEAWLDDVVAGWKQGRFHWPNFLVAAPPWAFEEKGAYLLKEVGLMSASPAWNWARFGLPTPWDYVHEKRKSNGRWVPGEREDPASFHGAMLSPADALFQKEFLDVVSHAEARLREKAIGLFGESVDRQNFTGDDFKIWLRGFLEHHNPWFLHHPGVLEMGLEKLKEKWGDRSGPFYLWVLFYMVLPYQLPSYLWRHFELFARHADPYSKAVALLAGASHLRRYSLANHRREEGDRVFWTPDGFQRNADVDVAFFLKILPDVLHAVYPLEGDPSPMPASKGSPLTLGFLGRYALVSVLDARTWAGGENLTQRVMEILRKEIPEKQWASFVRDMNALADPDGPQNTEHYGLIHPAHADYDFDWAVPVDRPLNYFSSSDDNIALRPYTIKYFSEKNPAGKKKGREKEESYFSRLQDFFDPILPADVDRQVRAFESRGAPVEYATRPSPGKMVASDPRTQSLWAVAAWAARSLKTDGKVGWGAYLGTENKRFLDRRLYLLEEIRRLTLSKEWGWAAHGLAPPFLEEGLSRKQFLNEIDRGLERATVKLKDLWRHSMGIEIEPGEFFAGEDWLRKLFVTSKNPTPAETAEVVSFRGGLALWDLLGEQWSWRGFERTRGPLEWSFLIQAVLPLQQEHTLWRNVRVFQKRGSLWGQAALILALVAHLRRVGGEAHRGLFREEIYWTDNGPRLKAHIDRDLLFPSLTAVLRAVYPRGAAPLPWGSVEGHRMSPGFFYRLALFNAMDPQVLEGENVLLRVIRRSIPREHREVFSRDMASLGAEVARLGVNHPVSTRAPAGEIRWKTDRDVDVWLLEDTKSQTNPLAPYLFPRQGGPVETGFPIKREVFEQSLRRLLDRLRDKKGLPAEAVPGVRALAGRFVPDPVGLKTLGPLFHVLHDLFNPEVTEWTRAGNPRVLAAPSSAAQEAVVSWFKEKWTLAGRDERFGPLGVWLVLAAIPWNERIARLREKSRVIEPFLDPVSRAFEVVLHTTHLRAFPPFVHGEYLSGEGAVDVEMLRAALGPLWRSFLEGRVQNKKKLSPGDLLMGWAVASALDVRVYQGFGEVFRDLPLFLREILRDLELLDRPGDVLEVLDWIVKVSWDEFHIHPPWLTRGIADSASVLNFLGKSLRDPVSLKVTTWEGLRAFLGTPEVLFQPEESPFSGGETWEDRRPRYAAGVREIRAHFQRAATPAEAGAALGHALGALSPAEGVDAASATTLAETLNQRLGPVISLGLEERDPQWGAFVVHGAEWHGKDPEGPFIQHARRGWSEISSLPTGRGESLSRVESLWMRTRALPPSRVFPPFYSGFLSETMVHVLPVRTEPDYETARELLNLDQPVLVIVDPAFQVPLGKPDLTTLVKHRDLVSILPAPQGFVSLEGDLLTYHLAVLREPFREFFEKMSHRIRPSVPDIVVAPGVNVDWSTLPEDSPLAQARVVVAHWVAGILSVKPAERFDFENIRALAFALTQA